MKRFLACTTILLAAVAITQAGEKPDLSGSWKMDAEKSDFGGAPPPGSFTRKIVHAEPSVVFTDEQDSAAGHEKAVRSYTTDSKEITYQWMGSEVKSAAHWEGDSLMIVGKVNAQGTEIIVTSTLTLSADGKMLTENDRLSAAGNDVGAFKLVLVKQQ